MTQEAAPQESGRRQATFQEQDFYRRPNVLAPFYSAFRVNERLLLTGHSHQAWPDRARRAHLQAFDDAAERVDQKWSRAFEQAEAVREGYARLMADTGPDRGSYALASSTHDVLIRWLSALDLKSRPKLLTTDGEFHTIRRQLARLEELGIEVAREPTDDVESLAERLAAAVDDRCAAVLVSSVLFGTGLIVPGLDRVAEAARRHGVEMMVDTYHSLNAVPFDLHEAGLGDVFAVGGGYKYVQAGEGNCFLRVPAGRDLRPVITGWFAEFDALSVAPGQTVGYGAGAAAFAGSTYDPTSHYRGAEVFRFFQDLKLTPELLRRVSRHQVGRLADRFDALDADPAIIRRPKVPAEGRAAFLTLVTPVASRFQDALRRRGVATDSRGDYLRFGPAPYHCDAQLDDAMDALGEVLRAEDVRPVAF